MKCSPSKMLAGALLLLSLSQTVAAQGPISDVLVVTFPNTTWVGSTSLPAGKYTIRQLPTASNPRLLEFSSDNGTKMETAVTTIAAIDNNNMRDNSVILEQRNGEFHLKNVWVKGKTYGYELPIANVPETSVKSDVVTLSATASAPVGDTLASAAPSPTPRPEAENKAVAQSPSPSIDQATGVVAEKQTASATAGQESVTPNQAQSQPSPLPAESRPAEQNTPAPDRSSAQQPRSTENVENAQLAGDTPPMPQTAAYWPDMLLVGLSLCAASLLVMIWPPRRRTL